MLDHKVEVPHPFAIFDGPLDQILEGFNAVTLPLDAGQKSDLNWLKALNKADEAVSKGYKLFWDLQLGLFDGLSYPLSNQAQFRSLALSLNHFCTSVWEKYQSHTVGICLYRGSANFSNGFAWGAKETENFQSWQEQINNSEMQDCRLYCQNAIIDFIKLLAEQLPNEAEPFVLLNISPDSSLLEEALLRDSALTMPLRLALQDSRIPLCRELAWNSGHSPSGYIGTTPLQLSPQEIPLALCMPSAITNSVRPNLEKLFLILESRRLTYRLIAEDRLTVEWNGLDNIIVLSDTVTPAGKRMLQGFCAAGGKVILLGNSLNLAEEISFETYCNLDLVQF